MLLVWDFEYILNDDIFFRLFLKLDKRFFFIKINDNNNNFIVLDRDVGFKENVENVVFKVMISVI